MLEDIESRKLYRDELWEDLVKMNEQHPSLWSKLAGCDLLENLDHDSNCRRCNVILKDYYEQLGFPRSLQRVIRKGTVEGDRNTTRFMIIRKLWKEGFDDDFILQQILKFNSNCNPSETKRNVRYHVHYTLKRLNYGK